MLLRAYLISFPLAVFAIPFAIGFSRSSLNPVRLFAGGAAAVLGSQIAMMWNASASQTIFSERTMVFPGLLGLIVAAAFFSQVAERGKKLVVTAALALNLAANLYGLSQFSPAFDNEMAGIGQVFRELKNLRQKEGAWSIGTDLDIYQLPAVSLISGFPERFRPVVVEKHPPRVLLPKTNPPKLFLLQSRSALEILRRHWPEGKAVSVGPFIFLANEAAVLSELAGKTGGTAF